MSESDLDAALQDLDLGDATGGEEDSGDITLEGMDEGSEAQEADLDISSELETALAEPEAEGEGGMELDDDLTKLAESVGDAPSGGQMVTPGAENLTEREAVNLEFLLDIKLHVTFEVGRSKMLISDLLTLGQGSVIELHRLVGDELDLLINGKLVAKGEVVVVNEKFGCRINEIIPPQDRIKHLAGYR